ncbi:phage tail assembly protein [Thalassospira alkalitolerans]|uniref:phage tail assembly protein n=1 Tax=Thalassospira alkalitolerans TaxID=1293890 RepID=UPI0030EDE40B|tara:strand:+ start:15752 stop:16036 length:285 start_codon:yes stop_codon:yes gene_type:complete
MEPVKIDLKRPIEAHGETLKSLTLDEPDCGGLDGVEITVTEGGVKLNLGDVHKIIASMAGIPPSAARTIKVSDLAKIIPVVMDFLPEFLRTGAK